MAWLDGWLAPQSAHLTPAFLTATTVLGLGSQLFVTAGCAALGQPIWALWAFVTIFNGYMLALFVLRRRVL